MRTTNTKHLFKFSTNQTSNAIFEVFYRITLRIAKMYKSHMIAKNLILPTAISMGNGVRIVEEPKKLKDIQLSNNTG